MRKVLMLGMMIATLAMVQVAVAKDIVDTAVEAGQFKTLVAAVKAAGLVETLKGTGPFTVFAPTDDAFAKLPAGTVEGLLKPENKAKLVSILTYHVVPGKIGASSVLPVGKAKTVQGTEISLGLTIDNARVVKTDIECSNGVIHVIDAVLLPQEKTQSSNVPRALIEETVAEGSRIYNQGDAEGCVKLYTANMHELLKKHSKAMPTSVWPLSRPMAGDAMKPCDRPA